MLRFPSKFVAGWLLGSILLAGGCGVQERYDTRFKDLPAEEKATESDKDSPAAAESPPAAATEAKPKAKTETDSSASAHKSKEAPREPRPRTAADNHEPIAITFEDLNLSMQMDIVYRPWMMTDRVKELEGKRIKIKGVIEGSDRLKRIKEFVLLKNKECKFGPGGQADHLAQIEMLGDAVINFTDKPVEVEGILRIAPFQGPDLNTWSVFTIEATAVRGG